jgi:hypothetical protein
MKSLLAAFALLGILCACGSPNSTAASLPAMGDDAPLITHRNASSDKVLLVTDVGTNEAYIVSYPSGKLLHTLTGFDEPQGTCSDGKGNFWVTSAIDESTIEYSSDGTQLGTLYDDNNFPTGCAYDPKTGNLAVTNIIATNDNPGGVAIYTKGQGKPTLYVDPAMPRIYFAAYVGSAGTLVVDGENTSYSFALASLAKGTFANITVKGATIQYPGGVGWSTRLHAINVGDRSEVVI